MKLAQFTYSDMKKPDARSEMLSELAFSVGTKSGNYGEFREQMRCITVLGAELIKQELKNAGIDYEESETLFELLK